MKKHHTILVQLNKILDGYKLQHSAFYDFFEETIEPEFYPDDRILYEQGDV